MRANCSPVPGRIWRSSKPAPASAKVLDDGDVAALFGLEMAEPGGSGVAAPATSKSSQTVKTAKKGKASAATEPKAARKGDLKRRTRSDR